MTVAPASLTIAREDPRQPEAGALVAELDEHLRAIYPVTVCHLLDIESLAGPDVRFFVARIDGRAVGCGALRIDPEGYGEVKRMYVRPGARGAGLGRRLLDRLEEEARGLALAALRLETGVAQPEAVALYRKAGFTGRGPYADYPDDPLSIFLEKALVTP
ncbi:GNAT family N-acetyltransferase [Azospirillum thermophilum]|uniref:GNAT family N-acetyltransferase n=1 Tax=Azospirillum thermophilum TaxID=2202148 RepID=A0A2S2CKW3_9PROT|nr:GNAT family N-acetyltransferase [Azospirillum thermophilum]AWK85086.1 GNAT family N-acetyltransferase [Azospirillum thermophilum]